MARAADALQGLGAAWPARDSVWQSADLKRLPHVASQRSPPRLYSAAINSTSFPLGSSIYIVLDGLAGSYQW